MEEEDLQEESMLLSQRIMSDLDPESFTLQEIESLSAKFNQKHLTFLLDNDFVEETETEGIFRILPEKFDEPPLDISQVD